MTITSGCSPSNTQADRRTVTSPTMPSISPQDARDRLFALGETWVRTSATVTYRTVAPVEGQPASTHQCLRQMVGGAIDR